MNNVNLIGRLTKDPETRYSPSGTAVTRFTAAVDRVGKEAGADFIPVTAFGKLAENCERYIHKGSQVGVSGRIQTGSYEKKDGTKVYTTEVIAERVKFLGGKDAEETPVEIEEFPDDFQQIDGDTPF